MSEPSSEFTDSGEEAAAQWLARIDRGLTPAEQDEYLQWRQQNPRHAAAIARLEKAWLALDGLSTWRPAHSPQPNPDLLRMATEGGRRGRRRLLTIGMIAAAVTLVATVAEGLRTQGEGGATQAAAVSPALIEPRRVLEDGSIIDMNRGAEVQVVFSRHVRGVTLIRGEAFFTVAKDASRPFIVKAGDVAIRAVGTAFNVRLDAGSVEVLVTEGKVHVEPPRQDASQPPPLVVAGQRLVVESGPSSAPPVLDVVTDTDVASALAWQSRRLEFSDTPLSEALEAFNRHGPVRLVLGDPELGRLRLGGTFRADNLEAFLRLLESGFGVHVDRQDGQYTLRRAN